FLASLFTGVGFWLVCWLFGVHFSMFWGFLAFILNFIPNLGSIIATIPPLFLGLIEIESIGTFLFFASMLIATQFYFGNIFEPKFMGKSLSINTVTIILGLVFWGKLWGITGMLLSVPLLVLLKVILSQIPDAQFIVKLMGTYDETNNNKKS
ncbi:MAG: AI-2E family transporter, partial [Flammeovirgaceae bacterium]|nr:AI-2E family transporter [Flammeovirgaceae bacterium]